MSDEGSYTKARLVIAHGELNLARKLLRLVLPDRRHGCLCVRCLEELIAEYEAKAKREVPRD